MNKDNNEFIPYKFRTMIIDTSKCGNTLFEKPLKSITPIGKLLRKKSLEEISKAH